jgi:hypothetical protein
LKNLTSHTPARASQGSRTPDPTGSPPTAEFYKSFEELIVHDLYNTLIEAHGLGFLPPTMREGDIVLL